MKNSFVWAAVFVAPSIALLPFAAAAENASRLSKQNFNPAVSLIIDGGFSSYSQDEEYEIAGFPLAGEAGVAEEGFALNEVELIASADVDDKVYGEVTLGIHQDGEETETDIEEAFFQTTALPYGFTVKGGKFFSELGYLNVHHKHAWDFADAPLVYRALLGRQFGDTGLQARWVAPTAMFVELGAEWMRGDAFPAGGSGQDGRGAATIFAHLGGDLGKSSSWQLGFSHLQANDTSAELGGHAHGDEAVADNEFSGEAAVSGVDLVYKWAPNGNNKVRNLKIQAEYFVRDLTGDLSHTEAGAAVAETSTLNAEQSGWYMQGVYQFMPQWRVGLRYDRLSSDNIGSDEDVLEETGFADEGVSPNRSTVMVDYSHSEFSRLRLQFSTEDSRHAGEGSDEQVFVQYVYSLGAHGAHRF